MTSARPSLLLLILAGLAFMAPARAEEETAEALPAVGRTHDPDPTPEAVRAAMARGIQFLLDDQQPSGAWGTPAPTLHVDIYAPNRGAHDGYRVATTALALSALLETGGDGENEKVAAAIRRAADWLIEHHAAKRATSDVLYNTWAHGYALEAFARLLERETDEERRARIVKAAKEAVQLLVRFEYVDGGWGYYDFDLGADTPGPGTTSFTTATCLVGLALAAAQGIEVPERLVKRGKHVILGSRFPNNAFAYSWKHRYYPHGRINKVNGSLARTPACLDALIEWGDDVPTSWTVKALDDLETYGHFLLIARKYPFPHEAWYQNSGYFCFYGYYYASRLLDDVPPARAAFHARRIAAHLVPLQEQDGSWWDYQLYRYHKPYGTAYVLMALENSLEHWPES